MQARGIVVGATSMSETRFHPAIELTEALGLKFARPSSPYVKRTPEFVDYAQGLRNFPVPEKLSIEEAATIFDMWMKDNALSIGV